MNSEGLKGKVRQAYSAAAVAPMDKHPFPVGREFAESLGYPADLLDEVPGVSIAAFTGVSNVPVFAEIGEGERVLDLGCGAGLDSLIAAWRTGEGGRVFAFDFSEAMLARARRAASERGLLQIIHCRADAERLPLPDGSVDTALVNGLFNLNPAREEIFKELARVLRTGGRVYAAELVAVEPPQSEEAVSESNWFA